MTRSGKNARIICTDAKNVYSVVALITEDKFERVETYLKDGIYNEDRQSYDDLFFASEKHEGWLNLYRSALDVTYAGCVYTSEKEAKEHIDDTQRYVTTLKIEWEE